MIIQIYSIQTATEALACVEAGADRIGLLVGRDDGTHFPCEISEVEAAAIFNAIGDKATKVLISVQTSESKVLEQTARLRPDVLHLCTGFTGDARFRERLRETSPDVCLMEAVGMTGPEAVEDALGKAQYADLLILDSVSSDIAGIGAAGVTHDWALSAEIVRRVDVPVILAGGLGPENVCDAIRAVRPGGVDSLTRTSVVENGVILRKDIERVRAFCMAVRSLES
jgi:phosphoribosylanthranilate isomerase